MAKHRVQWELWQSGKLGSNVRRFSLGAGLVLGALFGSTPAGAATLIGNIWITGNTTLTGDVLGSVEFKRGNITLDCQNHYIRYVDDFYSPSRCADTAGTLHSCAISARGFDNVTIKNCKVVDPYFDYGIYVSNATAPSLLNGWVHGVGLSGAYLKGTESAFVYTFESDFNGDDGISLMSTSNTIVQNGYFSSNTNSGIYEEYGYFNEFLGNFTGYGGYGFVSSGSSGSNLRGNTSRVNDTSGFLFNGDVGFLVDQDNLAEQNDYGIRVIASQNGTVRWSTARSNSVCDAQQSANSTAMTWVHNTFTKRCNVPAQ
jgi:hypothetical protein